MITDPVTRVDLLALRTELRSYIHYRIADLRSDLESAQHFNEYRKNLNLSMASFVVGLNLLTLVILLVARRLGWF